MSQTLKTQIEALKAAQDNNAQFDALVEAIRSDRAIRTSDVREIAAGFLGFALKANKGRAAALKAIADSQRVSARQAARGRVLERSLNAW